MIFEPKWKSLLANTTAPIFTPEQCQNIIDMGHQQKQEEAQVGHKEKAQSRGTCPTARRLSLNHTNNIHFPFASARCP